MARLYPVRVELANGTVFETVADQRDNAAAEGADIVVHRQPVTWVRHCAWTAARRAGKYAGSWEQFNDRDCVEAVDVTAAAAEDVDDDDSLDPGRTAPPAG